MAEFLSAEAKAKAHTPDEAPPDVDPRTAEAYWKKTSGSTSLRRA